MRLINADTVVHWQSYDDEHETFPEHTGTIADLLDQMTDEGCPETVDAVEVRRGRWIKKRYWSEGVGMGESYGYWYACSECNHEVKSGYGGCSDRFCSECGARMDGKGERHE